MSHISLFISFLIGLLFGIFIFFLYFKSIAIDSISHTATCETIRLLNETNSISEDKQLSINIFYHDHCR